MQTSRDMLQTFTNLYLFFPPGNIVNVVFDSLGKYVLTAGDKHIRVFHNVTGYYCTITACEEKLKQKQTSATKERLQKLIHDSKVFVQTLETKA